MADIERKKVRETVEPIMARQSDVIVELNEGIFDGLVGAQSAISELTELNGAEAFARLLLEGGTVQDYLKNLADRNSLGRIGHQLGSVSKPLSKISQRLTDSRFSTVLEFEPGEPGSY